MRYFVLATDYDGTLAHDGRVDPQTVLALERFKSSGRKVILVTGRLVKDLEEMFPELAAMDLVVAENGAVLYDPATRKTEILAKAPPPELLQALQHRQVSPLEIGDVILATWDSEQHKVLEAIRETGLETQMIFNKGAVMLLPTGVNKAFGLTAALERMGLSAHNAVGVGDAENDHALLEMCECAVAVANALPSLKERATLVTSADHGAGVIELIDRILENDLVDLPLPQREIPIGKHEDGSEASIPAYGVNVLAAGPSGGGKSTLTTSFIEQLIHLGYQVCAIDPEGDYQELAGATILGPSVDEALSVFEKAGNSAVVNLVGLPYNDERPGFFGALFTRLLELRARKGRPHWIVMDEAHHLLPGVGHASASIIPPTETGLFLITVHSGHLAKTLLPMIGIVAAVGDSPRETLEEFGAGAGVAPPGEVPSLDRGQALLWRVGSGLPPERVKVDACRSERVRHRRKYAEGELGPESSFYFTGAEGKLKLRARNLIQFIQLAEGVDDDTWLYHLHRGDYSRWLRDGLKSDGISEQMAEIEGAQLTAAASKARAIGAIQAEYTLPA